jgi:hypothetical protein
MAIMFPDGAAVYKIAFERDKNKYGPDVKNNLLGLPEVQNLKVTNIPALL